MRRVFRFAPVIMASAPIAIWHVNKQSYYQSSDYIDEQVSEPSHVAHVPIQIPENLPLSTPPALPGNLHIPVRDPLPALPSPRQPDTLPILPLHATATGTASLSTPVTPMFYLHNHSFEKAKSAFFRKYPHPSCPAVLSVTVEDETRDEKTGVIYRRRLITIANTAPWWTRSVLPGSCVFEEQSLEDTERQVLEVTSRNLTLSRMVLATEHSKFVGMSDPKTKQKQTLFVQTGGTKVYGRLGPVAAAMERWAAVHIRQAGVDAILMQESMMQEDSS